ncbi:MAG TPA: hypothetical protein VHB46_00155 [Burkholderiales bacterium]|nr:hypothetical protein [Burkholderiales bacterium]
MFERCRLAVFLLLMTTLPVQGYAATTMLFCGLPERSTDSMAHAGEHGPGANDEHATCHRQTDSGKRQASCATCMTCVFCNSLLPAHDQHWQIAAAGPASLEFDPLPPDIPDAGRAYRPPRSCIA